MKTIKQGNGHYPQFFALLCRAAGIPCVVIRGVGKAVDYQVGEQEDVVSKYFSSWNAVYVDGHWRIVHPYWAFTGVTGFNKGQWTKVEESGQAVRQKEKASEGKHVYSFDEEWFFPDPDQFIYMCRATNTDWQLLKTPWPMHKFVNVPHFKWAYFTSGLKLVSEHAAILKCTKVCDVNFEHAPTKKFGLEYTLFFDEERSDDSLPVGLQLDRYVIELVDQKHKGLRVRFPVRGIYKLNISCVTGYTRQIVAFRLENDSVTKDAQPFPINPQIGFGYGQKAEDAGLSKPSQVKGIMVVRQGEIVTFNFHCRFKLDVQSLLVHKDQSASELAHHVTQDQSGDEVTITVNVPEHAQNPEYALQVNVRPEGTSGEFENVANYLLTHGKDTADTDEASDGDDLRSKLVSATQARVIQGLEKAIPMFVKAGLPDQGDLTRARETLIELHEKALRDAAQAGDLEKLEKAIEDAKNSCVADRLQKPIEEAEKKLKTRWFRILRLNQRTVSEVHNYKRPLPMVHTVMKATYILLGEKQSILKKWENIQALLGKSGREGILRRISEFDKVHLEESRKQNVESKLSTCNRTEVCLASAGAGTFYDWSTGAIGKGKKKEN
nr:hypothetical protein BaRGS_028745 [Batillaria attramentaria]